jgi:cell division protein FtsQ
MWLHRHIRKGIAMTLWIVAGGSVLVLLIAAIKYRNNNTCKGYRIEIVGGGKLLFADQKDITKMITDAGIAKVQNKPIAFFDLRRMEGMLEKNIWIRDAQLFFDNNSFLHVKVAEREPVARIFTREGSSFFIDSSGTQLPLSEKIKTKLPVFTGYPAPGIRLHGEDSVLTSQLRQLGSFIRNSPFWMAEISQVDITPSRTFELIPTIGEHVVEFGDGTDCAGKFHRLFVFYREVLARAGFEAYARINVAYAGQVIGVKNGKDDDRRDSIAGLNSIRQLIRHAQQMQPDTARQQRTMPLETNTQSEESLQNYDLVPGEEEEPRALSGAPRKGRDTVARQGIEKPRTTKHNTTKP